MALGGLASGFGMGPGVSPPAVAAGTVVGLWCAAPGGRPPLGGVGGLVLGCVVDAGFGFAARPGALGRWCGCAWACGCVWFVSAY